MAVFYLCDGKVESCKKTHCFYNGTGACSMTSDINHARNFNHFANGHHSEKEPAEKHFNKRISAGQMDKLTDLP